MKRKITLGVCGGISAYKACDVASALTKMDYEVHVIMTENATKFISPLVFRTLTGNDVITDLFSLSNSSATAHIELAKSDYVLVIPATANFIGKIASGILDDALTSTVIATKAPVIIAPAMNNKMYDNSIVQSNINKLKADGYLFIDPDKGRLACGDYGYGRLANFDRIMDTLDYYFNYNDMYENKKVLITLGPTKNYIDPVRFISNPSTGKMGLSFARAFRNMGAEVTVVSGTKDIRELFGVDFEYVVSSKDMYDKVMEIIPNQDIFVSAAAVLDYTPKEVSETKLKKAKEKMMLELIPTDDILMSVSLKYKDIITIGFAAETDNVLENAMKKFEKKKLDYLIVNDVSRKDIGFSSDDNEITLIENGGSIQFKKKSKQNIAVEIIDYIGGVLD